VGNLPDEGRGMKQSTGVARPDGLSVSVYTRAATEAEPGSGLLVIEVNIPFGTLNELLPSPGSERT